MPNKNYIKGVRKERKLVNRARDQGKIAFRSAGSHSPIDVVIIDFHNKKIEFVQCKPDSMSENEKKRLELALNALNNEFICTFRVL